MIDNQNKTAIVFGIRNDRSIAFAIARKLYQSGCKVAVSYTADTKEDVLYLLEQESMDKTLAMEVDVRKDEEVNAFVTHTADQCGSIDYVLHATAFGNHSVMCTVPPGSKEDPPDYLDMDYEELMDAFNISAYSLIRICRSVKPFAASNASIVTLTYGASMRVIPNYAGMAICKAALENMVIYLAQNLGNTGVRVNAISPGFVMTTSAAGIKGVRRLRKLGKQVSPLGNISAEDVADTALYYFSDLSTKVTGNIHYLDGGLNIMGVNESE